jgi:hypothetical protein
MSDYNSFSVDGTRPKRSSRNRKTYTPGGSGSAKKRNYRAADAPTQATMKASRNLTDFDDGMGPLDDGNKDEHQQHHPALKPLRVNVGSPVPVPAAGSCTISLL